MSMNKFLCPTPREHCTGKLVSMNNFFTHHKPQNAKVHGTPQSAFECYCHYLEMTGHVRLSQREYRQPQGGILLLTRQTRFGTKVRLGKEGTRYMVLKHNGCIVSS
jgi:hypothetical protein